MAGSKLDKHGYLGPIVKLATLHSVKVPLSRFARDKKPWLTYCDANARPKECFLVLKETWGIKTILGVAANAFLFNWRLSSVVQTTSCLMLLVNQPWHGGRKNLITNHALAMRFMKGEQGLQWYYSENGDEYKPTMRDLEER